MLKISIHLIFRDQRLTQKTHITFRCECEGFIKWHESDD